MGYGHASRHAPGSRTGTPPEIALKHTRRRIGTSILSAEHRFEPISFRLHARIAVAPARCRFGVFTPIRSIPALRGARSALNLEYGNRSKSSDSLPRHNACNSVSLRCRALRHPSRILLLAMPEFPLMRVPSATIAALLRAANVAPGRRSPRNSAALPSPKSGLWHGKGRLLWDAPDIWHRTEMRKFPSFPTAGESMNSGTA